jgi:hypothetical protein
MRISQSYTVPASLDRVARALCSEGFNIERDKLRDAVVSAELVVVLDSPERLVFELRSREHGRKRTGGLDRSRTVETVTRSEYDRKGQTISWRYHGEGGDRFVLSGMYRLEPDGEGTRLTHEVTIEVSIPLIGKQIAKLVARDVDNPANDYKGILRRHLPAE